MSITTESFLLALESASTSINPTIDDTLATMISSTTSIMLTMAALACTTWSAPILNNSMNTTASVGNSSSAGNDLNFEFRYNCSAEEELSKNESNTTYLDFGIGLFVMKDYLKSVRVSTQAILLCTSCNS